MARIIKIVTVPNDSDERMERERNRLSLWVRDHGDWDFFTYEDEQDFLSIVEHLAETSDQIDVIEFSCHGTPIQFDHVRPWDVLEFGKNLASLPGFSAGTKVYLSACNTGMSDLLEPVCVAQSLSNVTGSPTFGTRGYMEGTFAEGNEVCRRSEPYCHTWPNAVDAKGRDVWLEFGPEADPRPIPARPKRGSLMVTPGSAIAGILSQSDQVDSPITGQLRVAPDLTLVVRTDEGVVLYDLLCNYALARDRRTGQVLAVSDRQALQEQVMLAVRPRARE